MRECSIHRVVLVESTLTNGTRFLRCPMEGCNYAKPIKYGPRMPKRGPNAKRQTSKGSTGRNNL